MPIRKTVMISSTARDLPKHRQAVMDACLRQGMFPLMMEHLPASDADAIEVSLKMVEEADIYLGIYAHRYGYVPQGHDISITEMEYNRATELGKPRLVFVMHDDHRVRDEDGDKRDKAIKLDAFKKRLLKAHVVNFFKSPANLNAQAIDSLSDYRVGDIPSRAEAYRKGRDYLNRQAMLERVRHAWIEGVLEKSLYHKARIELDLTEQPAAVERPWVMFVQEQGRPVRELPRGVRMSEVFDELDGALLILGASGTGKTTMLLELAKDLLDRAERDGNHLIPVVFNLSSWATRRLPLVDWLLDELNERYNVPRRIARVWLEGEKIIPLLDGLDEVAPELREECAKVINTFRDKHGLVPMVVCCRTQELKALAVPLRLMGAIEIQPLTREQTDSYLEGAGPTLAGVRAALRKDETLYELLDTPLMLSVVVLAHGGKSAGQLQAGGTVEEQRTRLFAAYADAMYVRRGGDSEYTRAQSTRWLSWLANTMAEQNQTLLFLENMQPSWLPTSQCRLLYYIGVVPVSVIPVGLFAGLGAGLPIGWGLSFIGRVFGAGVGIAAALTVLLFLARVPAVIGGLSVGMTSGLAFGLAFGLTYGSSVGIMVGIVVGALAAMAFTLLARLTDSATGNWGKIKAAEKLRWSWRKGLFGAALGALIGFAFGWATGWTIYHEIALMFGLAFGMSFGTVAALFSGLTISEMDTKVRPNQGIWRSVCNAVWIGTTVYLAVGLPIGIVSIKAYGQYFLLDSNWLNRGVTTVGGTVGLTIGLAFGSASALFFGGIVFIQHIVLRLILCCGNYLPWHLVRFLNYATERIFLRKVGGGYIFIHRLLQDYFAELWERKYAGTDRAA